MGVAAFYWGVKSADCVGCIDSVDLMVEIVVVDAEHSFLYFSCQMVVDFWIHSFRLYDKDLAAVAAVAIEDAVDGVAMAVGAAAIEDAETGDLVDRHPLAPCMAACEEEILETDEEKAQ